VFGRSLGRVGDQIADGHEDDARVAIAEICRFEVMGDAGAVMRGPLGVEVQQGLKHLVRVADIGRSAVQQAAAEGRPGSPTW
jgi:hypothetical protein